MAQFKDIVETLEHKLDADESVICLSDGKNWRKRLLPTYKFARRSQPKPVLFQEMRSRITKEYHFKMYPYLEADDVCGILMTGPNNGEKVTVSIDKDFYAIPGSFYNLLKDEEVSITWEEADRFHMRQTLVGDATDGFAGCPTIGKVRADRLLEHVDPEDWWDAVVAAYKKHGLDEERALMIARVARTLRYDEYDTLTNEIQLWTPNNQETAVLSVV
jgi:DNA polymerase-1